MSAEDWLTQDIESLESDCVPSGSSSHYTMRSHSKFIHYGFKSGEDRAKHYESKAKRALAAGFHGVYSFWMEEAKKARRDEH